MKKTMWRSLLLTGILAGSIAAAGLQTQAVYGSEGDVEYPWTVTFTASEDMKSTFSGSEAAEVLSGMQPGDTVTFRVELKNQNAKATKWYMKNAVLESLEESAKAAEHAGGAYGYTLTYTAPGSDPETIFSSNTVGGEVYVNESLTGLKEIANSIDPEEWFYLMDLGKDGEGGNGSVQLQVTLDGISQGNNYQDTMAQIEMQFGVELTDDPEKVTETVKKVNKIEKVKKNEVKKPQVIKPASSTGVTGVKTGDATNLIPYLAAAGAAGVLLLALVIVSMKRRKQESVRMEASKDQKGGL